MKFPKHIKYSRPVVALGASNAFIYIIPSYFLENYSIMCIRDRKDTRLIKKEVEVFCVEDHIPNVEVPKVNQKELMKLPISQKYLFSKKDPVIFVRKTTPSTQKLSDEHNLDLISNSKTVRDPFENKLIFRKILESANIKPIDGFSVSYKNFSLNEVKKAQKKYGTKIVVQAAELTHGGGVGTGFIEDKKDFIEYKDRMDRVINLNGRKVENIILTKFVSGTPSSVVCCVTRYGIIVGSIQTQIQDIPEVANMKKGDGIYCGHDWGYKKYSRKIVKRVNEIAQGFGKKMSEKGYLGIFGLDLIIDHDKSNVYPIECNPRYTDALPVASFFAMEKNLPSLEYFHLLEHLKIEYKVNIKRLNKKYKKQLSGSQILLMSREDNWTQNQGELETGIYEYKNSKLKFIKPSFLTKDIKNKKQFLITDGVPFKNTKFKPRARIMRLVFKKSILKEDKKLKKEVSDLINLIYENLDFKEIEG